MVPDFATMPPFTALSQAQLAARASRDPSLSQDLWSTLGRCDPALNDMLRSMAGYNDHLAQLTREVARALGTVRCAVTPPVDPADLMGWLDRYIWTRLFAEGFDPLGTRQGAPNARLLRLPPVVEHIAQVFAAALREADLRCAPQAGGPGPDAARP